MGCGGLDYGREYVWFGDRLQNRFGMISLSSGPPFNVFYPSFGAGDRFLSPTDVAYWDFYADVVNDNSLQLFYTSESDIVGFVWINMFDISTTIGGGTTTIGSVNMPGI